MASFVTTAPTRKGMAPAPLHEGAQAEPPRKADPVAQQMYAAVAVSDQPSAISQRQWDQLSAQLDSPDLESRSAASKLLDSIAEGTQLQTQQRAKTACCLILHTLAGLTEEQIGLAFGHPKGHISRLIRQAEVAYRQKHSAETPTHLGETCSAGSSGSTPTAPTLEQLKYERPLNHQDRHRLRRKAERWWKSILREPAPERQYFRYLLTPIVTGRECEAGKPKG